MAASTSEGQLPATTRPDAAGDAAARLYPARPFLAASVAVVRDGRVLVAARTRQPSAGLFSLPGGLAELGEGLEETALRELAEEVGVEASIVGIAGHTDIVERDEAGAIRRHVCVVAFAARWIAGEGSDGPEAAAVRWALPHEIERLPGTDGLARICARAVALAGPA